ncbi:MAG: hypothetical protein ABR866_19030 [Candidatus Korobacteraceae bacterium]|jgi:hypothetical protein
MEVIKKTVAPVTTAQPATATTQTPVVVNSAAKPAPLKPLAMPDSKLAGGHKETSEPKPETKPGTTAVPTAAPKVETKPVATASQLATTGAGEKLAEKKPEHAESREKLGSKLRRKGDILKSLRGGAHLVHTTEGLYRMVAAGGSQNPVSKRRVLAMISQKLLTRTMENGESRYMLDRDAAQKATEKKAEEKPSPRAEGSLRPA